MLAMHRSISQHIQPLALLRADMLPLWGIMTAQHMVEHLCDSMLMSMGKLSTLVVIATEPERLPVARRYLLGTMPLPRNAANPLLGTVLPPLQQPSLHHASDFLHDAIDAFYAFFMANPSAAFPHPIFGVLNGVEWEQFHRKHFKHHCEQFGLPTYNAAGVTNE